jgi:hypothetical protein
VGSATEIHAKSATGYTAIDIGAIIGEVDRLNIIDHTDVAVRVVVLDLIPLDVLMIVNFIQSRLKINSLVRNSDFIEISFIKFDYNYKITYNILYK